MPEPTPIVELVNLTTQEVTLITQEGDLILDKPNGKPASLVFTDSPLGTVMCDGFELAIVRRRVDRIVGLPEPVAGTLYVVSSLVADYAAREDCVVPHRPFRNPRGQIYGAQRLAVISR